MAETDRNAMPAAQDLSGFQRDLLYVIASVEPAKGLKIRDDISAYYDDEVNNGRLYPNLDTLVEKGLVEKGKFDDRTNAYELTDTGKRAIDRRRSWEAKCTSATTIDLDTDTHDRLLSYQRDDETLSETAARVLPAVLPHSITFEDVGIDAETVDTDTRFVLERWPDGDGHVGTWVYNSKTQYLRANKTVVEHTNLERDDDAEVSA